MSHFPTALENIASLLAATTMMSEGMKNIVVSMIENGVKPVSVCLSGNLDWNG